MKKIQLTLCGLLLAMLASATPTLIVGSGVVVNNTTYSSATNVLSQNYPSPQQLILNHGLLNNTNDIVIRYQVSADNTNFITLTTFGMPGTNAASETFQGYNFPVTNYFRIQVITTNSQTINASYGQ